MSGTRDEPWPFARPLPAPPALFSGTSNRRVLVIGGQGFVGKNLIPRLLAQGCDILSTGLRPPVSGGLVKTISFDARDRAAAHSLLSRFRPAAVVILIGHG